jgi:hypothetical protein
MAQKLDPQEIVEWQELAYSNTMEQEALVRVLIKKGIITDKEFLDELKLVVKEMDAKKGE